jgi:hypothetical protein
VLRLGQTAVLEAPLDELPPAVDGHAGIADHDLVEFMGQ